MADGSVLAQLHFGREDAERDVTEGLLLRGGFLPNAAYRAALSGRKMLIIGRKGSGKSAICMQLMAAHGGWAHNGEKILVTPDEAAGEEIRRFELQGLPGDSAKALIWRYVFAVHAARYIVAHAKGTHGGHKLDSVKALGRFLKQNGESMDGGRGAVAGWWSGWRKGPGGCRPRCRWRPSVSRRAWISPSRHPKGRVPQGSWRSLSRRWQGPSPIWAVVAASMGRCCSWSTSWNRCGRPSRTATRW